MTALALALLMAASGEPAGARYFWMSADGLETTDGIDRLVNLAAASGANGIIVQVMGRGEAWYHSDLIPEAHVLDTFDPLARVLLQARPLGLEVHAWVNAFLSWSAPTPPADPAHVLLAHPDWFMADPGGRSSASYSRQECEAAGIVGATLSPAVPGVRSRLASICAELASNYDIDGIHLDYIRYPNASFGFEPEARAGFFLSTGVDPVTLFQGSGRSRPSISGMENAWLDYRASLVTGTVRTVRAALRSAAPDVTLSCAVMADPGSALRDYSCDWRNWLEEGLVDFVCPMAYTTNRSRAGELAVSTTSTDPGSVVYGVAVFNQSLQSALVGATLALDNGARGICVYSLNTFDPADCSALKSFWGSSGRPFHPLDPGLFQMTARFSR
ncbi:MAG TPA: family 10 glycosylhydrolase [Candidatus Fermentibacter daniensis]|nr:MAG: hypothetical protein BWX47_00196 [candidate division Hyd24-12 bacterium ADurb.Bin004]HOD19573.1 family 10 glycosylhydrolase [Candidatus Fermentibacter daniensis]HOZ16828.1 family 10 glycosylhydrolase [Candidatus Fermentibacter daniensis]HPH38758.1 family 10 glycosylhydrolase [Candidatus Fermentibacter daniensis]HPN61772.1 family 10 glycosylhydrolase [Candidatus Fermentibacter daniensis]